MNKKKRKRKFKNIIKYSFLSLIFIGLLVSVGLAGVALAMIKTAPELDVSSILNLNEPSILYDNKEQFMDEAPTLIKRETVKIDEIPENLIHAFVSIEDERFYTNNGIDPQRIAGAVLIDIQRIVKNEEGLHGASTITQQLLKNTILTDEVSAKRKIQEMYLAVQLTKALKKDEIMEAYLNTIGLGGNIYGVQKASKQYFNKDVKDLELIQCAYIAGVTQNPYRYSFLSTYAKEHPSDYMNRTKTVLSMMKKNKYIDDAAYKQAIKDLDDGKLVFEEPKSEETANKLNYEWFSRPVMDAVKKDLMKQYHYNSDEVEKLIMYGGLKIYTTMDKNIQDNAQKVLDNPKNYGIKLAADKNGILQPQASAVVMDYRTGEVKVIIGGIGNQPPNSYNRAASTKYIRPTGSTIKPLAVYAPAIDSKMATAGTVIEDSPISPEIGKQWPDEEGKPYDPRNYDTKGFRGYTTLREALMRSINLVAIKLEYQIGLKLGYSYVEKFGIYFNEAERTSLSALSLGQFEGSNTLQMSAAFGTFGNNGVYTSPILYTKVVDKTGRTLLENKAVTRKVLSPQSSYIMYDLLKGPTSGLPGSTAGKARFGKMYTAGKTGTSSKSKDFWFSGLTPYYSGAVWIGHDKKVSYEGNKAISSGTSAAIWSKIMEFAHTGLQVKDIPVPDGLVKQEICIDSGKSPTALCYKDPRGSRVVTEWFIDGTQPTTMCDTHVEAKINKKNNKLATENTPKDLIESKVFIRRDYTPTETLEDQIYVLPSEYDTTVAQPQKTPDNTNTSDPAKDTNTPDTTGNSDNGSTNNQTINNDDNPPKDKNVVNDLIDSLEDLLKGDSEEGTSE